MRFPLLGVLRLLHRNHLPEVRGEDDERDIARVDFEKESRRRGEGRAKGRPFAVVKLEEIIAGLDVSGVEVERANPFPVLRRIELVEFPLEVGVTRFLFKSASAASRAAKCRANRRKVSRIWISTTPRWISFTTASFLKQVGKLAHMRPLTV